MICELASPTPAGGKPVNSMFTFVVPACNVADYAAELVASLKAQTDPDFDVLLVTEESSDDTLGVLERSVGGDPRFKIVRLPKSGSASVSRNYGIEHAQGEYLIFVDGDDWVQPETVARFRRAVEAYGHPDLVTAGAEYWACGAGQQWGRVETRAHALPPGTPFSGREALTRLMAGCFNSATWLQIYRREFLLNHRLFQVPGRRHQDDEWTYRVFYAAGRVVAADFTCYCYRKRPGSVTTRLNPQSVVDQADNLLSMFAFYQAHENEMSPELKHGLSSWICEFLFRFLLHVRYDLELRRRQLNRVVGSRQQFLQYCRMVCHARLAIRVLCPVLFLTRYRICFRGAQFLFRRIYWPLLMWYSRKK